MYLLPEQSRALYQQAAQEHFAILAVNADSPAAIVDCLQAAKAVDAPIIIESSLWQLSSHSFGYGDAVLGVHNFAAMVQMYAESEAFSNVPVIYHTDHIKGPLTEAILRPAIQGMQRVNAGALRASSISLDSSELSADENIALTGTLCEYARAVDTDMTLEMEAGVDDGLTSVEEARYVLQAVEDSNPGFLALWAPGVGTQHGFSENGFPAFSSDQVARQQELASRICGRDIIIALHGSSGLSDQQLQSAVQAGVGKVNWSTDSLACRSAAAAAYYKDNGDALQRSHPDFKNTVMDNGVQEAIAVAYRPVLADRMTVLGAAGKGRHFCKQHTVKTADQCAV